MAYYSILGLAFYIVPCLIPVLVIGVIIFAIFRWKKGKDSGGSLKKTNFVHFFDLVVSQLSIALSVLFFLYFLFSITKTYNVDMEAHYVALPGLVVGFVLSYKLKQQLLLFLSIIGGYSWWVWLAIFEISKMSEISSGDTLDPYYGVSAPEYRALVIFIGVLILGLLYYILGHIHSHKHGYNYFDMIYRIWSFIPATVMLVLLSNKFVLIEAVPSLLAGNPLSIPLIVVLCLMLICVGIVLLGFYGHIYNMMNNRFLTSIILTLFGLGLLLFIPKMELKSSPSNFLYGDSTPNFLGYVFLIFFNIFIFGEFLLLILYGYLKKNIVFISLGTVLLFILCIEKYVEWFSFTEKGLFFTGAGILMLVLGFLLERARRSIINNLKTNQDSTPIDGK